MYACMYVAHQVLWCVRHAHIRCIHITILCAIPTRVTQVDWQLLMIKHNRRQGKRIEHIQQKKMVTLTTVLLSHSQAL